MQIRKICSLMLLYSMSICAADNGDELSVGDEISAELVSPLTYADHVLPKEELVAYKSIDIYSKDCTFFIGKVTSSRDGQAFIQVNPPRNRILNSILRRIEDLHRIYVLGATLAKVEYMSFDQEVALIQGQFVAYKGLNSNFYVGKIKKEIGEQYEVETESDRGSVFALDELKKLVDGTAALKKIIHLDSE